MTYIQRLDRFDELLDEAKARGHADRALVNLLGNGAFDAWSRTHVVAALGDTTGPDGPAALRSEFAAAKARFETAKPHNRAGWADLMCACVWALGRRDGPGGTDVFIEAAAHVNRSVRGYGLTALAAVGDDRAWNDMLAALKRQLARKITSARRAGEVLDIIAYLARHCEQDAARRALLADLLRRHWSRLRHAETVTGGYPEVGPDDPPPAEIDFQAYVIPPPWRSLPRIRAQWESQSSGDAFDFTN
jgi:hypothetical protein